MWNTGCNFIANDTLKSIFILDQEDTRYSLVVPSQKIATFKGVIFPWCNRTEEILHKAFRVYEGESEKGDLLFYIFQNYNDNMVYFSREADWNKISLCADEPASYLNVLINRDRKPVCSIG